MRWRVSTPHPSSRDALRCGRQGGVALVVSAKGDTPQSYDWGWKKLSPTRRLKYRRGAAAREYQRFAPIGARTLSRPAAFTFSSPRRKAWG